MNSEKDRKEPVANCLKALGTGIKVRFRPGRPETLKVGLPRRAAGRLVDSCTPAYELALRIYRYALDNLNHRQMN